MAVPVELLVGSTVTQLFLEDLAMKCFLQLGLLNKVDFIVRFDHFLIHEVLFASEKERSF